MMLTSTTRSCLSDIKMLEQPTTSYRHVKDLQEVLSTLQKNDMRLNPYKCAFWIKDENSWISFLPTEVSRSTQINGEQLQK